MRWSIVIVLGAIGCGAYDSSNDSSADTPVLEEALGEASCLNPSIRDVFLGLTASGVSVHSPTTYDNVQCDKAWVVETDTVPKLTEGSDFSIQWSNKWERNKTQCVNGQLKVEVMFRPKAVSSFSKVGVYSLAMRWNADLARCEYPELVIGNARSSGWVGSWRYVTAAAGTVEAKPNFSLGTSLEDGSVRLAVSALTPAGSTQPFRVYWFMH